MDKQRDSKTQSGKGQLDRVGSLRFASKKHDFPKSSRKTLSVYCIAIRRAIHCVSVKPKHQAKDASNALLPTDSWQEHLHLPEHRRGSKPPAANRRNHRAPVLELRRNEGTKRPLRNEWPFLFATTTRIMIGCFVMEVVIEKCQNDLLTLFRVLARLSARWCKRRDNRNERGNPIYQKAR